MADLAYFPDLDSIDPTVDIFAEIRRLRRENNVLMLAHYYQESAVQDLADFVGDSLQLAQKAQKAKADVILFCGVHFMAETAKILNPDSTVVLPDTGAGCSLADKCHPMVFEKWLKDYPDHAVISYINCSAGVKALSDIICTSSNVVRVVNSIPAGKKIVFAPDRHLGRWASMQTGREMVLFPNSCVVHDQITPNRINGLLAKYPKAKILAHPECDASVAALADFVGSTAAMLKFVADHPAKTFIIGTEAGILHQMQKQRPDAEFVPITVDSGGSCPLCPYMRLNTIERIYLALRDLKPEVTLPESLRQKALEPLNKMLSLG